MTAACGRGGDWSGELGDGTTNRSETPVKVMDDVVAVSAGNEFSMAIKAVPSRIIGITLTTRKRSQVAL